MNKSIEVINDLREATTKLIEEAEEAISSGIDYSDFINTFAGNNTGTLFEVLFQRVQFMKSFETKYNYCLARCGSDSRPKCFLAGFSSEILQQSTNAMGARLMKEGVTQMITLPGASKLLGLATMASGKYIIVKGTQINKEIFEMVVNSWSIEALNQEKDILMAQWNLDAQDTFSILENILSKSNNIQETIREINYNLENTQENNQEIEEVIAKIKNQEYTNLRTIALANDNYPMPLQVYGTSNGSGSGSEFVFLIPILTIPLGVGGGCSIQ